LSTPNALIINEISMSTQSTYFVKVSIDTEERFDALRAYRPAVYHVDAGRNGETGTRTEGK